MFNRMKIRLLLIAYFIAVTGVCFAQNVVTQDSVQTTGENLENAKKPVIPSGRIILQDMKANNPALFTQYQNGKSQQRKGMILTCVGGGLIEGAAFAFIMSDITKNPSVLDGTVYYDSTTWLITGVVMSSAGVVIGTIGLSNMFRGKNSKNRAFQDFKNQYYFSQQPSPYFQMNIYPNRVGIAYVF